VLWVILFNFLRNCHSDLYNSGTILYSHRRAQYFQSLHVCHDTYSTYYSKNTSPPNGVRWHLL
jgi:hypothetical protein